MTRRSRRFDAQRLRRFSDALLASYGTPRDTATLVTDTLLEADRRGVASHGLVRLPSYCRQIEDGEIDVRAQPQLEQEHGATARVDGNDSFGALTGVFAMDAAIGRAARYGVGAVTARRALHFGTAAYYALRATAQGMIGLAATNTPAVMAPWGGSEPVVGNNPFAVACPVPDGRPPFVLDMAQTHVARGRIKLAELEGETIPSNWAIGADGSPTTDPHEALAGALLPFGGYKSSGLALAVEVFTGVLSGGGLSHELLNTSMTGAPQTRTRATVGTVGNLYMAIDPGRFAGRTEFAERMRCFLDAVKRTRPAPGYEEVLLPGETEAHAAAEADQHGIPLLASTVDILGDLGRARGTAFPTSLSE